jgi:hypothetical protein
MRRVVFSAAAVLASAAAAHAQYFSDFEAPLYSGSAGGTVLTGQDGWTLPAGLDQFVFTYGGNALGLDPNPTGGAQFAGARTADANPRRGQHLVDFSSGAVYTASYDFAANYDGALPAAANLASFSFQDSVISASFIALDNFMDPNNPSAGWKAEYNVYNAAGTAILNQSAGSEWTNLTIKKWYRQSTTVDFSTNKIVEVAITDLTTNITTTANPDWYLQGGAAGGLPRPTGVRIFCGGSIGNMMGWDNLNVTPAPATGLLLGLGVLAAGRRRRA